MTYKLTNSLSIYISIALLIGISACVSAAKGPFFQEANGTNPAKATIYLYSQYIPGMGILGGYRVNANGSFVTKLVDGGYYVFQVDKGKLTLEVEDPLRTTIPLYLEVAPGNSYFVRPYIFKTGRHSQMIELREVIDRDTAINEITPCRLIIS